MLQRLARARAFPEPASLDVYLGEHDTGCSLDDTGRLVDSLGGRLHVVPGADHYLPRGAIEEALQAAVSGFRGADG